MSSTTKCQGNVTFRFFSATHRDMFAGRRNLFLVLRRETPVSFRLHQSGGGGGAFGSPSSSSPCQCEKWRSLASGRIPKEEEDTPSIETYIALWPIMIIIPYTHAESPSFTRAYRPSKTYNTGM
mmetsp:Transcript_1240/g.3094  ORF Transcript_1240/g.3094 Transcript_1240/m.3094 type:complete len:124 (-) Transcript_1240:10-381(-)